MSQKCNACKLKITFFDFDIGAAIEAVSPITFRKINVHSCCFEILIETASQTDSKKPEYKNRLDEYYAKYV